MRLPSYWKIALPLAVLALAALACSLTGGDATQGVGVTPLVATFTPPQIPPVTTLPPLAYTATPLAGAALPTLASGGNAPPVVNTLAVAAPQPGVVLPPVQANCTPRADWPTVTVQAGETLYDLAITAGTTIADLAAANCLTDPDAIFEGQTLRVPSASPVVQQPQATPLPQGGCAASWFFTFRAGVQPGTAATDCPAPVQVMDAIGQDFEGGRVIWYRTSALGQPPDTLYVIYNDGTWESYADTWAAGQPESDPAIVPPANRDQPVRNIGLLWRNQPTVRERLGWAYGPELPFQGRRQQTLAGANVPAGQPGYTVYLDHGARGTVLRLNQVSAANGGMRWQVAGTY